MASYNLRDEKGTLKAQISARIACSIMDGAKGHFAEERYREKGQVVTKLVFIMDTDIILGEGEVQVRIWKGDRLVPA